MALGVIESVNPGQGGTISRDGRASVKFAAADLTGGSCTTAIVGRNCSYFEQSERANAGLPPATNVVLL
jgi:hypothetical protein